MMEREKREIVRVAKYLESLGLMFGSWGNLSVRKGDRMAITPSAVPYSRMKPGDIAVIELSGRQLEGREKSSEWRMHCEIYRKTDSSAIIHAHLPYSTAFAIARKKVKCRTEDAVQLIGDEIPVARYFLTGTRKLAFEVSEKMARARAVIMANHGIVARGDSLEEAMYVLLAAEKACMAEALARLVGRPKDIPKADREILKEKYRKYSGKLLK